MKSVRVYLVFWLSGLIAGVILVERWRRNGDIDVAAEPTTPGTIDGSPGSTGPTGPAKKPNLVGLVVTGAKLDAERVRQRVTQAKGPAAGASPATGSADSSAQ